MSQPSPAPKRVMFVDDDPNMLGGLERMLFDYADEWDLCFVAGGRQALEKIAADGADVVVTDMRMPGMGGEELLERLQADHPSIARIVLSGHAETEALTRALIVAHTFLAKPCKGDAIIDAVKRALDVHALVTDEKLREAAGRVRTLPTRPKIYSKLTAMLAQPGTTMGMLADAIAEDVVLSARVVMVANSALFSRGGGVRRVEQAVARIGVELLRALVLGIEMTESMRALAREVDIVHGHSLEVGFLARRLCREDRADEALLTGIVHDIGQLVLMQCAPRPTRKAIALEQPDAVMALEAEFGGVTHAQLGAYLLGLWGMSYEIVHAVATHHDPIGVLPAELDVADSLRVAAALLEGRSGEDPRWASWVELAERARASAA